MPPADHLSLRHIPPGRCLLKEPFEPGEVMRIPRAARVMAALVGYYSACPRCGLRRADLGAKLFREGPPIEAEATLETDSGERRVRFWIPSTIETVLPLQCANPRCKVMFEMRGGLMCVVGCDPMHMSKHAMLAELDKAAGEEHVAALKAWQEARATEIVASRVAGRSPVIPPAPEAPQSILSALTQLALRHSIGLDEVVYGILTEDAGMACLRTELPTAVLTRLMVLKDTWGTPPRHPVLPPSPPKEALKKTVQDDPAEAMELPPL